LISTKTASRTSSPTHLEPTARPCCWADRLAPVSRVECRQSAIYSRSSRAAWGARFGPPSDPMIRTRAGRRAGSNA
jgi:hypothetical protein